MMGSVLFILITAERYHSHNPNMINSVVYFHG